VDGIAKTAFTFALSLASLSFGAQLSTIIRPHFSALGPPSRSVRLAITILSLLIYAATFPAYFRLPPAYRPQATAALLFAFPGALTRYLLSLALNSRGAKATSLSLPLGTFTANAVGTALLGVFHMLQSMQNPVSNDTCVVLQGLVDGFCGCLTTVSTFVVELNVLSGGRAWAYAGISWGAGQVLLLVVLGPSYWAGHVREQVSCRLSMPST
jgi:CrcB protein